MLAVLLLLLLHVGVPVVPLPLLLDSRRRLPSAAGLAVDPPGWLCADAARAGFMAAARKWVFALLGMLLGAVVWVGCSGCAWVWGGVGFVKRACLWLLLSVCCVGWLGEGVPVWECRVWSSSPAVRC